MRTMENKLFNDNIGLVHLALRQLHCPAELYEDCYQEGCIGLHLAIQRYDESVGKFSTYAVASIRGRILRYMREGNELFKIPRSVRVNRNNIRRLRTEGLSDAEIIEKLGISELDFADAERMTEVASLDFSIIDDVSYHNVLADRSEYMEDQRELEEYIISIAESVCKKFNSVQADVCMESLYSRMYEETPITQSELASKYKISQPQVSRILIRFYQLLKEEYYK